MVAYTALVICSAFFNETLLINKFLTGLSSDFSMYIFTLIKVKQKFCQVIIAKEHCPISDTTFHRNFNRKIYLLKWKF